MDIILDLNKAAVDVDAGLGFVRMDSKSRSLDDRRQERCLDGKVLDLQALGFNRYSAIGLHDCGHALALLIEDANFRRPAQLDGFGAAGERHPAALDGPNAAAVADDVAALQRLPGTIGHNEDFATQPVDHPVVRHRQAG
nr:hypothetical protein [Devosia oryziradicis]